MLLLVDNGSAYTGDLAGLLEGLGVGFERAAPHECGPGRLGRYDRIVLSGRRRGGRQANAANSRIVRHAVGSGTRLLGICYGAEILALALGGTIRRRGSPRTGRATVRTVRENPLCEGRLDVHESHGYEVATLPPGLAALAESDGCRYEVVGHEAAPVFGTQFHPEMSPDGRALVGRFCSL